MENSKLESMKEKIRGNIEAVQELLKIESEGRIGATEEEWEILTQYDGWDGVASVLNAGNAHSWSGEYQDLKELLTAAKELLTRAEQEYDTALYSREYGIDDFHLDLNQRFGAQLYPDGDFPSAPELRDFDAEYSASRPTDFEYNPVILKLEELNMKLNAFCMKVSEKTAKTGRMDNSPKRKSLLDKLVVMKERVSKSESCHEDQLHDKLSRS